MSKEHKLEAAQVAACSRESGGGRGAGASLGNFQVAALSSPVVEFCGKSHTFSSNPINGWKQAAVFSFARHYSAGFY